MLRLAALLSAAALLAPGAVQAAFFKVTKTADTADGACAPADCSLREAVIAANLTPAEDTIYVPAGTYSLAIAGRGEDAAATGDLDVTAPLRILGAGRTQTILDGAGLDRVLHFRSTNASFELRGATVRNGKTLPPEVGPHGAGLYLQYIGGAKAPARLSDVLLENNEADFLGGAVFISQGIAASVDRCAFVGNTAQGGGGIYLGDAGDLTLRNSLVENNAAAGGTGGGGLYLSGRGEIAVVGSDVRGNTAAQNGGGVYLAPVIGDGFARFLDVEIADNEATAGSGGGVYASFGAPEFRRTLIAGNSSQQNGGGAFLWIGGEAAAVFENVTFSGNAATGAAAKGGGLHVFSLTNANGTFRNLTFADNAAPGGGTQIGADNPAFAANLVLGNSIVKGASSCSLALGTGGGNVDSGATCGLGGATDAQNAAANLGALAENGGLTRTRALQGANAALGRGADCPPEDQRGFGRAADGCDSGAFETPPAASPDAFACAGSYAGVADQLAYVVEDLLPDAAANAGKTADCLRGVAGLP